MNAINPAANFTYVDNCFYSRDAQRVVQLAYHALRIVHARVYSSLMEDWIRDTHGMHFKHSMIHECAKVLGLRVWAS